MFDVAVAELGRGCSQQVLCSLCESGAFVCRCVPAKICHASFCIFDAGDLCALVLKACGAVSSVYNMTLIAPFGCSVCVFLTQDP